MQRDLLPHRGALRARSSCERIVGSKTERLWEIGDIVGALEAWEVAQVRRSIGEEGHGMV
jgi:hypothetical protein